MDLLTSVCAEEIRLNGLTFCLLKTNDRPKHLRVHEGSRSECGAGNTVEENSSVFSLR